MKKTILALAVTALSVIAVGCNSMGESSSEETRPVITTESAEAETDVAGSSEADEESSEAETSEVTNNNETVENTEGNDQNNNPDNYSEDDSEVSAGPSIQTLNELIENNLYCMTRIFVLGSLQCEEIEESDEGIDWEDESTFIKKVTDSRFPDYKSLSDYIYSVYSDSTADMLLNNYPLEGDPKYINKDGDLYVDLRKDGGRGYYVNWDDRTISIVDQGENYCHFNIETTITEPADEPVDKPYIINCTAVYEDGSWVLEDMYS